MILSPYRYAPEFQNDSGDDIQRERRRRQGGLQGYGTCCEGEENPFHRHFELLHRKDGEAQMRWHVQSGYIAIPGSKNPNHIAENISIFDFELTDDEMKQIAVLDTGHRYENW